MRILIVVNWLERCGIQVMLYQALPFLRRLGVLPDVCCLAGASDMDEEYRRAGCRIFRIPKRADPFAAARALDAVLSRHSFDIVHSHMAYTSGGIALAARRRGVPNAISFHNATATALYNWDRHLPLRWAKRAWLLLHRRLMNRYGDMMIGHSRINIAAYAPDWERDPERYRVLMNGTEFPTTVGSAATLRERLGIAPSAPVLLHVANFNRKKNHAGLLRIAQIVIEKRRGAVLVMVGDGPLRRSTESLASSLGILANTRFAGIHSNVWPYYAMADAFLFPSEMEGFGNVLVEAQGVGVPVVASDIGAHHESVAPHQRRFLFALPDYDHAARLVLEQLEAAESDSNPWVWESRNYVRREFSIERMASDLNALYNDLISQYRRRRGADRLSRATHVSAM